jgi:tetratricopeptide (TPR) repeat protein/tRNA A-37 threonylcarbamoyl transferase component Bud32
MLGRGAHGNVYQANDTMLGREVAIKVPRAESLASPELQHRFLREAQAVAALSHPNLVTVYEAGAWGPIHYITSCLCTGPNLSQWIAQQAEPIAVHVAVRLTKTLADAVAYVHSQGILHRDLKPSNVLLEPIAGTTSQPQSPDSLGFTPKLTDFGLAKYLSSDSDTTATGDIVGTPAYMAPEQASGRVHEIGPAADIYALGAILYHLLTGHAPFQGATKLDTLRQVNEGAIVPPRRLRLDLPRDLEAICLKCVEHEPNRRYASSDELAADLQRFVDHVPVLARRAGPISRLVKWSRRRPLVACLTYSLSLVVVVALAALTWQWRWADQNRIRAQQNFLDAYGAIHEFQTILYEGSKYDDPRLQPLRRELLEASLRYYRRFVDQSPNNPELLSDFAQALFETAVIESTRGSKTDALAIFSESLSIWDRLTRTQPAIAEHWYYLAKTHHHIALLEQQFGHMDSAAASNQCALDIRKQLVQAYPDVRSYRNALGSSYYQIAEQEQSSRQWDECLDFARQASQTFEALSRVAPDHSEYGRMLAASTRMEGVAHLGAGRPSEALECYERALHICEDLTQRKIGMPDSVKMLAKILLAMGSIQARNNATAAMQSFERSRVTLEQLVSLDSTVHAWRRDLAACYFHIAALMDEDGERVQRQQNLEEALKLREQLVHDNPNVLTHRRDLGRTMLELAKIHFSNGQLDDALVKLQSAYPLIAEWVEHHPNDIDRRLQLSIAQSFIGSVQSKKDNPADAIVAYRNAVSLQQQLLQVNRDSVAERARLAEVLTALASQLTRLHRYSEAKGEYVRALEHLGSIRSEHGLTATQQVIWATATEGLADLEHALATGS